MIVIPLFFIINLLYLYTFAENLPGMKPDEERIRRAAERDGRRYRRNKKRSLVSMKSHTDGMSTDDELPDMAVTNYRNQQGITKFYFVLSSCSGGSRVSFFALTSKNLG